MAARLAWEDGAEGPVHRLRWHALALLVLLAALVPVIGTDSAFVTDESFVVIQLDNIERTGEWTLPHPFPEVDPEGAAFPMQGSSRYEGGYTLYGKHPALVYLYQPVHRAFGIVGLVVLSVLGTWAAALVAARLAERIRTGSGVVALWLVGAGSPLFFDAFVIHSHTIAAALAGLVVLGALRAIDEERRWVDVAVVAAALAVALLRSEGVLFALAFGGALGLLGLRRRRGRLVLLGLATAAAGPVAYVLDRAWSAAVAGGESVAVEPFGITSKTFLEGRATSIAFTWLMPGYREGTLTELVTMVGALVLVAGVVLVHRRPDDEGALLLPAAGAGLLLIRSGLEWGPVPGLVIAFCVGAAGLVLVEGAVARHVATRLIAVTAGAFAVAVALTQYAVGGHTEWGGRYFALSVPLIGAVSAASFRQAAAGWSPRTAKVLHASLVVAALAIGTLAVTTLRSAHDRNRERTDGVLAAAAELPAADGLPPVVVTEDEQVARLARGRFNDARFLLVAPSEVDRYLGRLADAGVEDLVLVSIEPEETLEHIPPIYEQVGPIVPHDLQWEPGGGLIRLHLSGS